MPEIIFNDKIRRDFAGYEIKVSRLWRLSSSSSLSTYKVNTSRGVYILKAFGSSQFDDIEKQVQILHQVAKYYHSIITPTHPHALLVGGYPAYMYRFFCGKRYSQISIKDKYFIFGRIVAELDTALMNLPVKKYITNQPLISSKSLSEITNISFKHLMHRSSKLFSQEKLRLQLSKIRHQYIHKDLHFFNLLYNTVTNKYLVIDTGGMSIQPITRELAVPIGNVILNSMGRVNLRHAKDVQRGYETLVPLTPVEKRSIPIFIIQKKIGEISYINAQLAKQGKNKRFRKIISSYKLQSKRVLSYVLREYSYLVDFFSEE